MHRLVRKARWVGRQSVEARSVFGEQGTCGVAGRSCVSRARIEGNGTRDRMEPPGKPELLRGRGRARVRVG